MENFRGDGAGFWGSLAPGPDGDVVAVSNEGLQRSTTNGAMVPLTSSPARLEAALGAALGRLASGRGNYIFEDGGGIAVGPTGTVYTDIDAGPTSPGVSAILTVSPTGRVSTLWRSRATP